MKKTIKCTVTELRQGYSRHDICVKLETSFSAEYVGEMVIPRDLGTSLHIGQAMTLTLENVNE